jgi:hypothetical protein
MKNRRLLLLGLGLVALVALGVTGCFITSGQILAHYALPDPFTINGDDGFERVYVDLNTVKEYDEHKDKLKDISDLAVVGKFTNTDGPGGGVLVYITAGNTALANPAAIIAGGTRLWGPGTIGAAPATRTIGWDASAGLFSAAGKKILINEAKGDGEFTLYMIGTPETSNTIRVDKGFLILVLGAGV